MARIPMQVAEQVVLRHFPRVLRAGLCDSATTGRLARDLASEVVSLDPVIAQALGLWIESGRRLPSGEIAVLDALAVEIDEFAPRDIADALLMLSSPAQDGQTAARLCRAAWSAVEALSETGARLHQLALASAAAQLDVDEQAVDASFVTDLDAYMAETFPADRERKAAALSAWREALGEAFDDLKVRALDLAVGLALVGVARGPAYLHDGSTFADVATSIGRRALMAAEHVAAKRERARRERRTPSLDLKQAPASGVGPEARPTGAVPDGHVVVCAAVGGGAGRSGGFGKGFEAAIGKAVPLAPTPDLSSVRSELVADFPYGEEAVDTILGQVSPGRFLRLENPVVLEGSPGAGKSRFWRRFAETLGVRVYRVDGTNDAGGSFAGTERRWHTAEPSRPFMAVALHRQANPCLIVEEVDKAALRRDYGRLWDSLLLFTERETSARFMDPCLQAECDLSHVLIVMTANRTDGLPGPLLDRVKVVRLPEPRAEHLEALAASVLRDVASERGLDHRFFEPLAGFELDAVRRRWRGGSVRALRRALEAVLRAREQTRPRILQ